MCPFKKAFPFVLLLHLLLAVGIVGAIAAPQHPREHIFTLMPAQGQGELLKAGEAPARCPLRPELIRESFDRLVKFVSVHAQAASAQSSPHSQEPKESVESDALEVHDKPIASLAAKTTSARTFVGGAMAAEATAERLTAPVALYQPAPRHFGQSGEVVVSFTIAADGSVQAIELELGSDPDLVQAVERAVSQWRFSPAQQNGQPIALRVRQVVEF